MIIDSFIFNDELDILEFRLELLGLHVDRFIIVEADKTHTGLEKPFHFADNSRRFKRWESKIHHYMFSSNVDGLDFWTKPKEFDPTHSCWKIENQQRNAILDVARQFNDDDILIISDCDEIPSYEAIEAAATSPLPIACKQDLFYYNLTNLCNQDWRGSIFTTIGGAKTITQGLRDMRNALPALTDGGWHLSWFGNIEKKLSMQAHQELNTPEFNNAEHIKRCVEQKKDLFNRNIELIEVGDWILPDYFKRALGGRFNG